MVTPAPPICRPSGLDTSTGTLASLCRRARSSVLGDFAGVLAAAPGSLESFWACIEPGFDSGQIQSAAAQLRHAASVGSTALLHFSNHLRWLSDNSYSREDMRQIRYVVEVYHAVEPVFAILAALGIKWTKSAGARFVISSGADSFYGTCGCFRGSIEFADASVDAADHRPAGSGILYRHALYEALAVWPEYLARVWEDVNPVTGGSAYRCAVVQLQTAAESLTSRMLPSSADDAVAKSVEGLCARLQGCLAASAEAMLISSGLRAAFIDAEMQTRNGGV